MDRGLRGRIWHRSEKRIFFLLPRKQQTKNSLISEILTASLCADQQVADKLPIYLGCSGTRRTKTNSPQGIPDRHLQDPLDFVVSLGSHILLTNLKINPKKHKQQNQTTESFNDDK